jgi:hypothetical protein
LLLKLLIFCISALWLCLLQWNIPVLLFNYLNPTFYKINHLLKCSRFYTATRKLFWDCVLPGRATVWPCSCTATFRKHMLFPLQSWKVKHIWRYAKHLCLSAQCYTTSKLRHHNLKLFFVDTFKDETNLAVRVFFG